jgi:2-polyprenyl-3-methyl-5-hydroxy-6-metoxy-1,4-benzoquinol methylase
MKPRVDPSHQPKVCRVCAGPLRTSGPQEKCDLCGFEFLGAGDTHYDYDAEYDENSDYNSLPADQVLAHYRAAPNTAWALAHLQQLRRDEGLGTLFEFGASQGAFLKLAAELGYEARGVELASASVAYARDVLQLGEAVERGVWRGRRPEEVPVDVVCAFEVLEHSEDPIGFLQMMRSWTRPGGVVLISVPNGRRLSVRVGKREAQDFPPHHLMYWNTRALSAAATRVGLRVVESRTSDLTQSDLLRLLAPGVAARRAVDSGGFQPVGQSTARVGLPAAVKAVYPLLTSAGRLAARLANRIPELGQRLMLLART